MFQRNRCHNNCILAAEQGLGTADINLISVMGERLQDVILEPFLLPSASSLRTRIPPALVAVIKKMIKYYPCVRHANCIRCGACIKACPKKVILMKNERIVIDYSGCISCFCCQEACPASAIGVKKSLLARLLGL